MDLERIGSFLANHGSQNAKYRGGKSICTTVILCHTKYTLTFRFGVILRDMVRFSSKYGRRSAILDNIKISISLDESRTKSISSESAIFYSFQVVVQNIFYEK